MPGGEKGPIFIIGPMGSGTTLLRLMLDSHEHIAIPEETGFMRIYDAYVFTPFKYSGRESMERLGFTDEARDALLREHFHRLFMNYAEQQGKRRWGEKSPLHTWHVRDMAHLFPDAQFVMTMRHPGASVHSNVRRFARYRKDTEQPRWHWRAYGRLIAQHAEMLGDRMRFLRYEDLVLHPEPVLRELLDWLGEPWSDAVLHHHEVQAGRGGEMKASGKSRADQPIDRSRIDRWTTELPETDQQAIATSLGRMARFYGYDARDPLKLDPLHEGSAMLTTGPQLAARIDRFPNLDLRRTPRTPLIDALHDPRDHMPVRREELPPERGGPQAPATPRGRLAHSRAARAVADRLPPRARRRLGRLARRVTAGGRTTRG